MNQPLPPSPSAHHVTMRLAEDRVLARDRARLRLAARVLLERGAERGLIGFRVADTHVHALVAATREQAGVFAQAAETAMQQTLHFGVPFDPARIRPVATPWHLVSSLRYVLRQEAHHGLDHDALHDGSYLPDALGMRLIDPTLTARIRQAVPRLPPAEWARLAGWEGFTSRPMALADLADAAAAVVGRGRLGARDPRSLEARRAAVHVGVRGGLRAGAVGDLLRLSSRAVCRQLQLAPSAPYLRAIELQLRLRSFLGAARHTDGRGVPSHAEVSP